MQLWIYRYAISTLKSLKKTLKTLRSDEQKEVLDRLISLEKEPGDNNFNRLNLILDGTKGIKDSTIIRSVFKKALLQYIDQADGIGLAIVIDNLQEKDKKEVLVDILSHCAVNENQVGFNMVMNRVSEEAKEELISKALIENPESQLLKDLNLVGFLAPTNKNKVASLEVSGRLKGNVPKEANVIRTTRV